MNRVYSKKTIRLMVFVLLFTLFLVSPFAYTQASTADLFLPSSLNTPNPLKILSNVNSFVNTFSSTVSRPIVQKYLAFVGDIENTFTNPYDQYRKGIKPVKQLSSKPKSGASIADSITDSPDSHAITWLRPKPEEPLLRPSIQLGATEGKAVHNQQPTINNQQSVLVTTLSNEIESLKQQLNSINSANTPIVVPKDNQSESDSLDTKYLTIEGDITTLQKQLDNLKDDVIARDNKLSHGTGFPRIPSDLSSGGTINRLTLGNTSVSGNSFSVESGNVLFSTSGTINQIGTGQVTFSGNVDANNGLDVTGNLTVSGTSALTGAATLSNTLTVSGATTLSGAATLSSTLNVTGVATFSNVTTSFNGISYGFPSADGTLNQRLTTNGQGQLSWATVTGGGESFFTDGGTFSYLTTTTQDLVLGDNDTANASFFFDVSDPRLQLNTLNGDPRIDFQTASTTRWLLGVDNSDRDIFRISGAAFNSTSSGITIVPSSNNVGIATTNPVGLFEVYAGGEPAFQVEEGTSYVYIANRLIHQGDTDTYLDYDGAGDQLSFTIGGASFLDFDEGATDEIEFNFNAEDIDFRIQSDNRPYMFFMNAGTNRIGINVPDGTPASQLEIQDNDSGLGSGTQGSDVILTINNASTTAFDPYIQFQTASTTRWRLGVDDSDGDKFRITTSTIGDATNASGLTIDFSTGNVGIGTTAPASTLELGSGQLSLPVGAVTAPSLTFTGDTDMGIYHSTSDRIGFVTSGAERMRIRDTGVEIGLFNADATTLWVRNPAPTTAIPREVLVLRVEDSNSAGDPGIGGYITFEAEDGGSAIINTARIESVLDDVTATSRDSSLRFYTLGPNTSGTTLTERLRIDSSGNVGIGTIDGTPASRLEIQDNDSGLNSAGSNVILTINNASTTAFDPYIQFQTASTTRWLIGTDDSDSDKFRISTSSFTGNAEGITILNTSGFVGIGTTNPSTKLQIVGGNCSDDAGGGGCTADLAEYYNSSEPVEKGDIVAIDMENTQNTDNTENTNIPSFFSKVKKSDKQSQTTIIGVVSTAPAMIMDGQALSFSVNNYILDPYRPAVALSGRVLTKVSTENGPILAGDRITASSIPGVGMKATEDGQTIGIALENFPSDNNPVGKILVFINLGYSKLTVSDGKDQNVILETLAERQDELENRVSLLELKLNDTGILDNFQAINTNNQTSNTSSLSNLADNLKTALQSFTGVVKTAGEWAFEKISVKRARVEELEIVDKKTGDIYCTWIEDGEWFKIKGECGNENSNSENSNTPPAEDAQKKPIEEESAMKTDEEPVVSSDPTILLDDGAESEPAPKTSTESPAGEAEPQLEAEQPAEEPVEEVAIE